MVIDEAQIQCMYAKACDRYVGYVTSTNSNHAVLSEILDHAVMLGHILGIADKVTYQKINTAILKEKETWNNPFRTRGSSDGLVQNK
jgi:hypothetical protein